MKINISIIKIRNINCSFIDLRSIVACRSPSDKIPAKSDSTSFDLVVTDKIVMSFCTLPNNSESQKLYESVYIRYITIR